MDPLMEMNVSDLEDHTRQPEIDATRATARLPGLDIEIVHRRSPGGDAEQISINLLAAPSFEAFGRFVENANLFALWAQAVQMAWLPWRSAAQAMLPPGLTLPQVGSEATTRSSDGNRQMKYPAASRQVKRAKTVTRFRAPFGDDLHGAAFEGHLRNLHRYTVATAP
jgi:hypothetical protein